MPDRLSGRTLVIATGHDLSLALLEDGRPLASHDRAMSRGHAEALVPALQTLLEPWGGASSGCARIVVETGPGSFTGLRVGLAAARALGLAWGVRVAGVRSTQLVAAAARAEGEGGRLLVALLAPRGQIWVEGFEAGGFGSVLPPAAILPQAFESLAVDFAAVAGTAGPTPRLAAAPRASALAGLACGALGEAELLYVRAADDGPGDSLPV
jgi:tRNA threonylcarbamoyl adenosine modification protein YeaZ